MKANNQTLINYLIIFFAMVAVGVSVKHTNFPALLLSTTLILSQIEIIRLKKTNMTLYNLYLKQVEAWKERFVFTGEFDARIYNRHTGSIATTEELLSSRHKDTIELIEAEIERKRGMKRDVKWFEDNFFTAENAYPSFDREKDRWVSVTAKETYNLAIDEDIAYLESQLTLLKNER